MPPYQPPHLRDANPSTSARSPVPGSRPQTRIPNSSSILAFPPSDLKPSTRTDLHFRPKPLGDDMEMIQSVSRSGGDGAEGDALKDWGLQERYRGYIQDRLDKHYGLYPRLGSPIPTGPTEELESLGSIVLLFRKLREGIVASHRIDKFAIAVFEQSAQTALIAHNTPQLISSLSGLIPGLYSAVDNLPTIPASDSLDGLTGKLSKLQLDSQISMRGGTDNRDIYISLLLLYHLCSSNSLTTYHSTLVDLTRPQSRILRQPFSDISNTPSTPRRMNKAFIHPLSKCLRLSRRLYHILSEDRFDPISFWRILKEKGISDSERKIISWASERVRERAWEVLRRAYMEVRADWAMEWLGLSEVEVGEYVKGKGIKVVNGRIKLR